MDIIECGIPRVDQYVEDVLSGEQPTAQITRKAIKRFQRDLKNQQEDPEFNFYFEPEAFFHLADFMETNIRHFQGRFANKLLKLEPWQCFLLSQIYCWLREQRTPEGEPIRRFRNASIFIPKKQGKTFLTGALAIYHLLYSPPSSELFSFAMNRSHARKLGWNAAKEIIKADDTLTEIFKINNSVANLQIKCRQTGSTFEPFSNNETSADGRSPLICYFDEIKDLEDYSIYETMQAGTVIHHSPLTVAITTFGYNTQTVGYTLYQDAKSILEGEVKDETTFALIYSIDKGDSFDDKKAWKKANPNYGVSVPEIYVEERIKKAKNSVLVKNSILTKNLNVWGKNEEGWVDVSQWDACHKPGLTMADVADLPAYITIDLSSKLDLTNVKITFSGPDGQIYPFDFFYLPEARFSRSDDKASESYKDQLIEWEAAGHIHKCGSQSIDYKPIKQQIVDLWSRFNVKAVGFDPWNSAGVISDLQNQGMPESIFVEYTQAGFKNWNDPMQQTESRILDGTISHNGNAVMRWCIENTITKENTYESIRPDKPSKAQKIDGTVTLIMAVGLMLWTEPQTQEKQLSPYVQRIRDAKNSD